MFSTEFQEELRELLNRHSVDNKCETPDFILAHNLVKHLENVSWTMKSANKFVGGSGSALSDKLGTNLPLTPR